MCGFAGFLRLNSAETPDSERLEHLRSMSQQLALRGPDEERFYDDGTLSLVFRRLSIIDVKHGHQPIWNEDETLFTCVNGEIYNHVELREKLELKHRFRTHSDSENVLHLFEDLGSEALPQLNGMFSIVVWDKVRQELFLARDRLGIKPLYYTLTDDYLLFGSELKALLAHPACPRTMDWNDIRVGYGTTLGYPTFVEKVHQLPGGCHASIRPGGELKKHTWWHIDYGRDNRDITAMSKDDFVKKSHSLFIDGVHRHMRSDVPVGIFLSGGFDSSLLAAVAAQTSSDLHCFCIDSSITRRVGDVEQAEKVSEKFSLRLHKVQFPLENWLEATDFTLDSLEYYIWLIDSPRFNWEWVFKHELHRYAKSVCPDMKVMILGQGADEFSGGYSAQQHTRHADWKAFSNSNLERVRKERLNRKGVHHPFNLLLNSNYLDNEMREHQDGGWRAMCHQSALHLQYYNLWHEDRVSSGQSMEARVPFLDHKLVEHMLTIDPDWCPELLYNKEILRRLMDDLMPEYPRNKTKVAFMQTGTLNEIHQLDVAMVRKVFPEFRARYLGKPESLFSDEALTNLYRSCFEASKANYQTIRRLRASMSITIFDHQCRNGPPMSLPGSQQPPSPLREA